MHPEKAESNGVVVHGKSKKGTVNVGGQEQVLIQHNPSYKSRNATGRDEELMLQMLPYLLPRGAGLHLGSHRDRKPENCVGPISSDSSV